MASRWRCGDDVVMALRWRCGDEGFAGSKYGDDGFEVEMW
jgi:hypothetical protein